MPLIALDDSEMAAVTNRAEIIGTWVTAELGLHQMTYGKSAWQICMHAIHDGFWVAHPANPTTARSFRGICHGAWSEGSGGQHKPPSKVDPKTQAERQRIVEDIARALRGAGYECSDKPDQPKLRRDNLTSLTQCHRRSTRNNYDRDPREA
jgi:hypothetical protein